MRVSRRWLAALWLALGLLPGVERILVAHVHESASPVLAAAGSGWPGSGQESESWLDCAACHARATLGALAFDAHPERHGAQPAAPPAPVVAAPPATPHAEAPPARGPPHPIV
jgi:hypothetical protein